MKNQIKEEVKTGGGNAVFIWHPDKILKKLPNTQVYGFCLTPDKLVPLVRDKGETRFTLPGGGVEEGENAEEALIREFIEEAQFKPGNVKLLGSVEVIEKDDAGNIIKHHQQIRFFCQTDIIEEFVPGKDGWEIAERIFVRPEDLPRYIHWLKYPTGKAQFEYFLQITKNF